MGSKMGWLIGAFFGAAVLIIIGLLMYDRYLSPTGPTPATTDRGRLELKAPDAPVTLVLPAAPAGAGDAGDDYRRAVEAYRSDRRAIEALLGRAGDVIKDTYRPTAADLKPLTPIAEAVTAAASKKEMTYTWRLTPQKMLGPYRPRAAGDFQRLADVLKFLAYCHAGRGEEGYPEAERRHFERFTMGWHLMNERRRLKMVQKGFGLQRRACQDLEGLYALKWKKPERFEQVQRYRKDLNYAITSYEKLRAEGLRGIPEGFAGPHPGDIFNLAENHADPAVRVNATLMLGVVKLTCSKPADKRYVRRLIERKLAMTGDPIAEMMSEAARSAKAFDKAAMRRWMSMEEPPEAE